MPKGIQGFQKGHGTFVPSDSYSKLSKKFSGAGNPFFNKKHSSESRIKQSLAKKGMKATSYQLKNLLENRISNKGKTYEDLYGVEKALELRKRLSYIHSVRIRKPRNLTPEQIKKMLRKNKMSSLEIRFEQIINKLNLPYKFVGNGEVVIGRKCPDFVNINGEKIAIEVFYKKHKIQFRNKTLTEWRDERYKLFQSYGWNLLFFDETEVREDIILERINNLDEEEV